MDKLPIDLLNEFSQQREGEVLYQLLYRCLQQGILKGRLRGGERLPSSRELAAQLKVSRNTVRMAYDQLIAEGYVESHQGAGSFITSLPEQLIHSSVNNTRDGISPPVLSELAQRYVASSSLYAPGRMLLQPAVQPMDQFPRKRWRSCLSAAADADAMFGQPPAGLRLLREQIARHLSTFRGIQVSEEQILITSGSQQASFMLASMLCNPGDPVLLETPGYPGTEAVLTAAGACVTHINWQVLQDAQALNICLADSEARALFITPSRNFPLGHTLPLEARLRILHWAAQNNRWIVEDDYDSEFAEGHPVSALFALDQGKRVIYTGTFSRTMFPALRLGYMVLPEALVPTFLKARRLMDGGLSAVAQAAMGHFMSQGDYSRHIRKMRQLYQERRSILEKLLADSALSHLPATDAGGGMHLVLALPDSVDDKALVRDLMAEGIGIRALSHYASGNTSLKGLVLGFALNNADEMQQGIDRVEAHYLKLTAKTSG